ncbi:MAG: hypothetical protein KF745_12395 [Phycisphaeraceae bacterium]|nr:hypothetical protein [Phycisphaeraceae bacterium]
MPDVRSSRRTRIWIAGLAALIGVGTAGGASPQSRPETGRHAERLNASVALSLDDAERQSLSLADYFGPSGMWALLNGPAPSAVGERQLCLAAPVDSVGWTFSLDRFASVEP